MKVQEDVQQLDASVYGGPFEVQIFPSTAIGKQEGKESRGEREKKRRGKEGEGEGEKLA
jgi:hypothetical protein